MKKLSRLTRLGASAVLALTILVTPVVTARADDEVPEDNSAAIIAAAVADGAHACNTDMPEDGTLFVRLDGTFASDRQNEWLNLVNSYRREACENGYPDPRDPSRRLTPNDYAPMIWSSDLEQSAMLRAAEASLTMYHYSLTPVLVVGHDRAIWERSYGASYGNETIAWSSNPVASWYGERNAWVNGSGGETGHYTAMIDPSSLCIGIAGFNGTYVGLYGGTEYILDENRYVISSYVPGGDPINTSAYNSQIAEIYDDWIANVNVTCEGGFVVIGNETDLKALATIKVVRLSGDRQFSDIEVLPSSWGCEDPDILSVDGVGNAVAVAPGTAHVYCYINGIRYNGTVNVLERASEASPSQTLSSSSSTPASDSGYSGYSAPAAGGGAVGGSFVPSASGSGIEGFVDRLYTVALGRNCDPIGRDYWLSRVRTGGATGSDLARGFLFSQEFLGKNMSNEAFVDTLYATFFNRTPDALGRSYWLNRLNNGESRQNVISGFTNSIEWHVLCTSYGVASGSAAAT